MTKIGDAFFNMNHVLMVHPTITMKRPFDFGPNGKNYKPTVTVVSAIDGKEVAIDVGEYTDNKSALVLAQEYVSKIEFK